MKHTTNPKRGRGRSGGGRRPNHGPNRTYDSNGPEVRVRGTVTQVCDRYLALARDASSAGDRIKAEGYLQHAEHYYRVVHSEEAQQAQNQGQGQGQGQGRFNGYRDNITSPAEIALSGEQAPVFNVSSQNSGDSDQGSEAPSKSESDEAGSTEEPRDVVEDTGESDSGSVEEDAAANA